MSGAVVQLTAKGIQDAVITGNPEVSFFRQQYKRHTNFAYRHVELLGTGTYAPGGEVSYKIPRNGDLLNYLWILNENTIDIVRGVPGLSPFKDWGEAQFELYIGGQLIDRFDSTYNFYVWPQYLNPIEGKTMYSDTDYVGDNMIYPSFSNFLPLHFSFCDGYPLPLVAMQYHEVEVRIRFNQGVTLPGQTMPKLYACYSVLDTDERLYFNKNPIDMIFEQVQNIPSISDTAASASFDLSLLNHPVKMLFVGQLGELDDDDSFTQIKFGASNITLNGNYIFDTNMPSKFFNIAQPYYHCRQPASDRDLGVMYAFAVDVSSKTPTGSCNFSRIDEGRWEIPAIVTSDGRDGTKMRLHAVNWNVLHIENGMAGVRFSA